MIKTRGAFPSDEAALKLLYLAVQHVGVHWKPAIVWPEARLQFMILFGDRITWSASLHFSPESGASGLRIGESYSATKS